ncbi:transmembrane protein 14C-like [Argiope bruennichi]|uniref:Transmembrane protein 14C like protein n=1 Tax=Argiope bruennichi TaxID=94029 RepID=A0A8T0E9Z6_ARGBR|nr:transmembrane protein 14C-like [Argiope bruennichi]KAF8768176.1 Transmembrane protein 14C like protein [Argiope bruennichi]
MGVDVISACYALSVAAGGVMGYVKAGSTSSLIAGLTFGSILAYGAYQTSMDESNFILSFVTTSTLGAIMLIRFYNSGKFMPAGLICSLSGLMLMRFIYKNMLSSRIA